MARILLVDDDDAIASAVAKALSMASHVVEIAADGERGIELFFSGSFDLVLLDVMLPRRDGFDVCRNIRSRSNVPILMLTARDDEIDRVLGLEIGADDYVVKPFSIRELGARVKALLRRRELDTQQEPRSPSIAASVRKVLDASIDESAREVMVQGRCVELSRREFDLLLVLVTHPRRVMTREWLMNHVWGREFEGIDRTVDVHVMRLRDKLGRDSQISRSIVALRGVGYRFGQGAFE
jgi:DNA-binding response OmpR family regulator